MRLVDSHCHLQDRAFDADRPEVLARALDTLAWLVVVGEDSGTSEGAVRMASDRLYVSIGAHPYRAASVGPHLLDQLRALAQTKHTVAIGEIGLDYHRDATSSAVQQEAFRVQLELACELGLPVVVHNRAAHNDIARILDEFAGQLAGGVMHCFDGDAAFAKQCLGWGLYISFAGNITYPTAHSLREAARAVPMDRLLVETDSPHLAPQPVRRKRCEPAFLHYTVEALAAVKGVHPESLAAHTTLNASRLFRVQPLVEAG